MVCWCPPKLFPIFNLNYLVTVTPLHVCMHVCVCICIYVNVYYIFHIYIYFPYIMGLSNPCHLMIHPESSKKTHFIMYSSESEDEFMNHLIYTGSGDIWPPTSPVVSNIGCLSGELALQWRVLDFEPERIWAKIGLIFHKNLSFDHFETFCNNILLDLRS